MSTSFLADINLQNYRIFAGIVISIIYIRLYITKSRAFLARLQI